MVFNGKIKCPVCGMTHKNIDVKTTDAYDGMAQMKATCPTFGKTFILDQYFAIRGRKSS